MYTKNKKPHKAVVASFPQSFPMVSSHDLKALLTGQKNKPLSLQKQFSVDKTQTKWQQKKPHSKKQRKELLEKCKNTCFLIPEKLKFPICNKVSSSEKNCSYNCKGVKAAAARAGEWKYHNVLSKAKATATQLDCYNKKEKL